MAQLDAALLRMFAIRAIRNQEATLAFILTLIGLGLMYTIFHVGRQSSHWMRRRTGELTGPSILAPIFRKIRKHSIRGAVGVPSLGHVAITAIFVALNLICTFANLDNSMNMLTNLGSRTGWLAIANLLFVIFFALKNTPLAFLTAWSYERLNCLHRIAGYTAVAHAIIHTGFYAYYFCTHDMCNRLVALTGIFGTVAGLAWVLMALTAMVLRRWWYELFYYVHIVLWVVSVVSLGIHQPNLGNKISIATVVAGSMWGLDRLIRFVRLMVNSANNMAIVTPLPNGGTRVTLAKTPAGTTSGKHFFLWIPRIRMAETHPFTITSAEPLEFVIASHNGFTGDLHKFAVNNPGVPLTASVEGPYGTVPDLSKFETVVLVAGGSGATFTFGLAHALLAKAKRNAVTKRVYFVWVIKYNSYMDWFVPHLVTLRHDPRFTVHVFVTRSAPPLSSGTSDREYFNIQRIKQNLKRNDSIEMHRVGNLRPSGSTSSIDLEKYHASSDTESLFGDFAHGAGTVDVHGVSVEYRRPDVANIIRNVVGHAHPMDRVLISGCGPGKLTETMRETGADCIRSDGPSIEVHCEAFGW